MEKNASPPERADDGYGGSDPDFSSPPPSPPRSNGVSGKDLAPVSGAGAALSPIENSLDAKARSYSVRPGDTLYSVARASGTDARALAKENGLRADSPLYVGSRLRLPKKGATTDKRERLAANATAQIRPTSMIVSKKTAPSSAVAALRESAFAPGEERAQPASFSGSAPTALSTDFNWPVRTGKVTSAFGPKKGGLYNEGVNISANKGEPVLAAADGEVVYSGNELRGYGNLILIKHPNGYITTYAHNNNNSVNKGDAVRRGQVIATVGDSGNVSSPQLHFSIREGKNAVDPGKFFRNL